MLIACDETRTYLFLFLLLGDILQLVHQIALADVLLDEAEHFLQFLYLLHLVFGTANGVVLVAAFLAAGRRVGGCAVYFIHSETVRQWRLLAFESNLRSKVSALHR